MMIDDKPRCFGSHSALYAHYHDTEWGVPVHDDRLLFEMLILEGAHAGLSWETVLKKREGYRNQFYDFDVKRVANMTDDALQKALQNPAIIRHRQKVFSARKNANVFLDIQAEFGTFDAYLWGYVDGQPVINHSPAFDDVPTATAVSDALSKDLKRRGMSFVGTTIMYAYMQAVGLVDDHIATCWKFRENRL